MLEQVSQLPKVDALIKEHNSKALFAFYRYISWSDKIYFLSLQTWFLPGRKPRLPSGVHIFS